MIGNARGLWSESAPGNFSGTSDTYNFLAHFTITSDTYNFLAHFLITLLTVDNYNFTITSDTYNFRVASDTYNFQAHFQITTLDISHALFLQQIWAIKRLLGRVISLDVLHISQNHSPPCSVKKITQFDHFTGSRLSLDFLHPCTGILLI